jgi:hypothetical protein
MRDGTSIDMLYAFCQSVTARYLADMHGNALEWDRTMRLACMVDQPVYVYYTQVSILHLTERTFAQHVVSVAEQFKQEKRYQCLILHEYAVYVCNVSNKA